jgi:hypothetical protein
MIQSVRATGGLSTESQYATYGALNVFEFVSEIFGNKAFQEELNKIKYPNSTESLLDRFKKILTQFLEYLGLDTKGTALSEGIASVFRLLDNQTDAVTVQQSNPIEGITDPVDQQFKLNSLLEQLGKIDPNVLSQSNSGELSTPQVTLNRAAIIANKNNEQIQYALDSVRILNSDIANTLFDKGIKNNWSIDKIAQELKIPKDEKALIAKSYDEGNTTTKDLAIDIASKYSYTVDINTSQLPNSLITNIELKENEDGFYTATLRATGEVVKGDLTLFEGIALSREYGSEYKSSGNSNHYKNLVVPGGINYQENEILTPDIIPSIKGHGKLSTDQGIGWFRADERNSDIRRVLELQSDLFQKGRDKDRLVNWSEMSVKLGDDKISMANSFLQLLNKEGNWVTFFIKSIIQDSAKKGYEKVLFPKGKTAVKIEGGTTEEIEQQLQPIKSFYDDRVTNTLIKQFGADNVVSITDEFGNTWNEITINDVLTSYVVEEYNDLSKQVKSKLNENGIFEQDYMSLTQQEKEYLLYQTKKC